MALLVANLILAGCGEDPAAPGSTAITVATVEVTPASAQLTALGQTVQLAATAYSAAGTEVGHKSFTWSTSDSTVARVSSSGSVTAAGAGSARVTATTDGKSGSATVTVVLGP